MDTYSMCYPVYSYTEMPINHKVFLAQFDAIKMIADEGPCVLVGRCADYALESYPNVVSIFIRADMEDRIRRVATRLDLTDAKAKDLINKTDKKRASYYNYYTNKKWGEAASYELCLNSSELGVQGTAKAIEQYILLKESIENNSFLPVAVKSVLNHPKLRGIRSTIGQVIEVEEKYTTAITTVLGFAANNIIVDNEENAKEASIVDGISVIPVSSLNQVVAYLNKSI